MYLEILTLNCHPKFSYECLSDQPGKLLSNQQLTRDNNRSHGMWPDLCWEISCNLAAAVLSGKHSRKNY